MNCAQCGKPINNRDATRFCNRACYLAYRVAHPEEFGKKEATYICEYCGKPVRRKASEVRNHVFCSRDCSNKAQSEALKMHPELRENRGIPIVCATCGKTFYVKPYRAEKSKYCSRACFGIARFGEPRDSTNSPSVAGYRNPNYKGSSNNVTARSLAFSRFGKRCMVCGFDVIVAVHHIQLRSNGGTNDLTNLIVLCPNHHAMAHAHLISIDELIHLNRAAVALLSESQLQFHLPEDMTHPTSDRLL